MKHIIDMFEKAIKDDSITVDMVLDRLYEYLDIYRKNKDDDSLYQVNCLSGLLSVKHGLTKKEDLFNGFKVMDLSINMKDHIKDAGRDN